jgi:hypothetical protein
MTRLKCPRHRRQCKDVRGAERFEGAVLLAPKMEKEEPAKNCRWSLVAAEGGNSLFPLSLWEEHSLTTP